jgi:hypothetical protein
LPMTAAPWRDDSKSVVTVGVTMGFGIAGAEAPPAAGGLYDFEISASGRLLHILFSS